MVCKSCLYEVAVASKSVVTNSVVGVALVTQWFALLGIHRALSLIFNMTSHVEDDGHLETTDSWQGLRVLVASLEARRKVIYSKQEIDARLAEVTDLITSKEQVRSIMNRPPF
jgi:hypothetical protein